MEYFYGTNEADDVLSPMGPSTYYLLNGNDTITAADERRDKWGSVQGTPDVDIAYLGGGHDSATGFDDGDVVHGGRGNDVIAAAAYWPAFDEKMSSFVSIYGEAGNDSISGATVLVGGLGDDTLVSYGGRVEGGPGDDVYMITRFTHDLVDREGRSVVEIDQRYDPNEIYDKGGSRVITGDAKDIIRMYDVTGVTVRSGDRADLVEMVAFKSVVYAGGGNDTVSGASKIYGATGRDIISDARFADGGQGHDVIEANKAIGGTGNDTIICRLGYGDEGDDLITGNRAYGGDGNDTIDARNEAHGEAGDDVMTGKILYGGDGNDRLEARAKAHGGAGDDVISGGGTLKGANGDDELTGNASSDDLLLGGRGADVLNFALGEGSDVLRGDGGPDTYVLTSFEPDDLPEFIDTADSIEGFQHGLDHIDLRAREGIAAFDDLVIEQVGDFVTIEDEVGYLLVVVVDDTVSNFTADDFVF